MKQILLLTLLQILMVSACDKPRHGGIVNIKKENGRYVLYRNGEPFNIKGAAGHEQLDLLRQIGGNTIRVWDTVGLVPILKKADELGIAVIVGLPIPESEHMDFYNDPVKVAQQYLAIKTLLDNVKNEPALLMWCVGNELTFPNKPSYSNFYTAFNQIVDMIHRDDPDHPVTTTMVNFQRKDIFNIKMRTNIDVISFNTFGRLSSLRDDLNRFSWFWSGPYIVTEWGIDGPWEGTQQTAWGAWIEPTSTNKAKQYQMRYEQHMPIDDAGFLGSLIFYWGQKQETTHTWFSIFDQSGNKTEIVSAAALIWTGKTSLPDAPKLKDMLVDGRGAAENIVLTAGKSVYATLHLQTDNTGLERIEWEVYAEDWHKVNDRNNTVKPLPIDGAIQHVNGLEVLFMPPEEEGPYRIFATIYDDKGNIATGNTPFYVVAKDEKN